MTQSQTKPQVKECMTVTMEYKVRTTTRDGKISELDPVTCDFVYGVHVQYPSVESAIMNKSPGDRVQVYVSPEEMFGLYDEELIRELPRSDFKEDRLKPETMYREMRKKTLVQFLVKEIRDDIIIADFNDPRAGAHADFDILIKDVREATKEEMKPSCALP